MTDQPPTLLQGPQELLTLILNLSPAECILNQPPQIAVFNALTQSCLEHAAQTCRFQGQQNGHREGP